MFITLDVGGSMLCFCMVLKGKKSSSKTTWRDIKKFLLDG
jgi:hypothetical protein